MLNPLPYLDNDLTSGEVAKAMDAPKPDVFQKPTCLDHNLPTQMDHVNDLCFDEVEEYLESVEQHQKTDGAGDPYGGCPMSPFYGRTTPLLYGDDSMVSSLTWHQPALESLPYYEQNQNVALTDLSTPPVQTTSNKSELQVVVPDFTLLDTLSPGGSGSHNAPPIASTINSDDIAVDKEEHDIPVQTPTKIKDQLRKKIQKRRSDSGKDELVVDWKKNDDNQLSEQDLERRRRRRESNRRAAQKSRVKKRRQNEVLMSDMEAISKENDQLKVDVELLSYQLKNLTENVRSHVSVCRNSSDLLLALNNL